MKWVAVVLGIAVLAAIPLAFSLRPHLPPAERGRRLAERMGCFGCHGPGGLHGAANPGRTDKTVPTYGDDLMMYAKTHEEVREWIRDGVSSKKKESRTWQAERDRGALRMPAFGRLLSKREIDELTSYVSAVSGMEEPPDSLSRQGLQRAEDLGCVGCHGPGGRLARPNPGSLKGYVPSWDGSDFRELVKTRAEFEEWVERGVPRRLERNPIAREFLRRASLRMPGYERHLGPGDVEALRAYVEWLRRERLPEGVGSAAHP